MNGAITEPGDAYGPPNDLDANGTPDFQEEGAAATITTEPTDQDLVIGVSTFSVVAAADTYQWEESQDVGVAAGLFEALGAAEGGGDQEGAAAGPFGGGRPGSAVRIEPPAEQPGFTW